MFENLLFQNTSSLLKEDIDKNMLPNSILFSGTSGSGKLTAALELARVLSCKAVGKKGEWSCTCPSCLRHKSLTSNDILITGSRDCILEILAAKDTFINALTNNESYLLSANYLFVRSVRKLTSRFNPIFYQDDDKFSKISPILQIIGELLEEVDPLRKNLDVNSVIKNIDKLVVQCEKLESSFMYDSIPVSHIKNASLWARYTIAEGKKVLIIENADRMLESVRNALLKILEEPPEGTLFILTTSRRGAVMPTILSRVRTYPFVQRNEKEQQQVVNRVFHKEGISVEKFLLSYLPVSDEKIKELSTTYLQAINSKRFPKLDEIVKSANQFEPRLVFSLFLTNIFTQYRDLLRKANVNNQDIMMIENQTKTLTKIKDCYEHVTIFNQNPMAALEKLAEDLIS